MRYLLEDDYPELKQQDVIDALSYDHDYAQFRAKELIEFVMAAVEEKSTMTKLMFMNQLDDATFNALRIALCGCVRGKDSSEVAELDQTIMALALFLKSHPLFRSGFAPDLTEAAVTAALGAYASDERLEFC